MIAMDSTPPLPQTNILITQCCYCLRFTGVKDAQGAPGGVSHGICMECWERVERELESKDNRRRIK